MKNKFFDNLRSAYSLAELLITLAVIGTLAALTMPMLKNAIPNKYEAMHKKADYALEHAVAEIVNDEYLYGAQRDPSDATTMIYGLKNTYAVNVEGTTYSGNTKFCKLFASKFNKYAETTENCSDSPKFKNDGGTPSFISTDGIQWLVQTSNFNNSIVIAFRVSAENDSNATHCGYVESDFQTSKPGMTSNVGNTAKSAYGFRSSKGTGSSKSRTFITTTQKSCQKPDTFIYVLTPEGKLIKDSPTTDSLSSSTSTSFNNGPSEIPAIPPETSGASGAQKK